MPTKEELTLLQALPLELKIKKTEARIREFVSFYGVDGVYISFSGGKDSTVLLHKARKLYPSMGAMFVNTGLEFPEIQAFVKSFDNTTILRPKMSFNEVISKYGYPFISKEIAECVEQGRLALSRKDGSYNYRLLKLTGKALDKNGNKSMFNKEKYEPLLYVDFLLSAKCCNVMKKSPAKDYAKKYNQKPITAQMASESHLREQQWLKNGCNGFQMKSPISNPMSFGTEQDVLQYIKQTNLQIASVYGEIVTKSSDNLLYDTTLCDCGELCTTGCDRTGCIFCGFGAHLEKGESRFERLKKTHPKQYEYCMGGGGYDVDGLWKPTRDGLGMAHCIDELNKIYGKNFIKY